MIQCQSVSNPSSTVMTRHGKAGKTQLFHDYDQIICHGPFAVRSMLVVGSGAAAPAVTPKVRTDYGKMNCQQWCNIAPHQMSLRKTVQKKQTRSRTKFA